MAEKTDRELYLEKVQAAIDKPYVPIDRRINGLPVGDMLAMNFDFPMVITMGCGGSVTYATPEDFPTGDAPCNCGNPDCYFVKFPS